MLALLLTFLALYPLAFVPSERLTATLASLVGGGLSFASVSFTAARACAEQRLHAARLIAAGSRLLRFAVITALALGLATTRERLATQLGPGFALDVPLRVLAGGVTTAAIALAFSGFRTLVLLLGPELEVEAARHLRQLLAGGAPAKGAAPEPGGRE